MIHVDVTKFGNIPDGGGWRFVGKQQGDRNRAATPDKPRSATRDPLMGREFVHTVIDDHSRVAYAEIHADEKAITAIGVLQRAVAWFADRGVTVKRVLSDNGSAYKSHAWADACERLRITRKKTRPYRPQTNGKIERFHRTLGEGWAYARFYGSETERRRALPGWLHFYNHHRTHSAIAAPPISRLNNLPETRVLETPSSPHRLVDCEVSGTPTYSCRRTARQWRHERQEWLNRAPLDLARPHFSRPVAGDVERRRYARPQHLLHRLPDPLRRHGTRRIDPGGRHSNR